MAQLSNTPTNTVLRLEARKAFSFSLYLKDANDAAVDITGCSFTIVAKPYFYSEDDALDAQNIITNDTATIVDAAAGHARFDLQASDLDEIPGEYPFVVVVTTAAGYTVVLLKGTIDLQPNVEFASTSSTYVGENPVAAVDVILRDQSVVTVKIGALLPPGLHYLTDAERQTLATFVTPDTIVFSDLLDLTGLEDGHTIVYNAATDTWGVSAWGITGFSGSYKDLSEMPAFIAAGATAEAARTAIGAGTSSFSGSYDDLADTPDIPDSPDDIGAAPATQTINAQTGTTYTLQASDASKLVTLNNTAAITVTVPADVIPAGQSVDVVVLNTGMATLVGSGGMALQPEGGLSLTSRAQYSVFTILALSTTLAVVTGSLAAA